MSQGLTYKWDMGSTYVQNPPYFTEMKRDPAPSDVEDQCGDNRLDAEARDEHPIKHAPKPRRKDRQRKGQRQAEGGGQAGVHKQKRRERPADRHERPYREVDAPRGDDQRHADADDDDGGDLRQVDVEGAEGEEVRGEKDVE